MPTVLRLDGYRFYFYSREPGEPPHIHVELGDKLAKFWLNPIAHAGSKRFRGHELTSIRAIVEARRSQFLEAWNEYFHSEQ